MVLVHTAKFILSDRPVSTHIKYLFIFSPLPSVGIIFSLFDTRTGGYSPLILLLTRSFQSASILLVAAIRSRAVLPPDTLSGHTVLFVFCLVSVYLSMDLMNSLHTECCLYSF